MTRPLTASNGFFSRPSVLLLGSAGVHVAAVAAVVASPASWPMALTAVAANHLGITVAGLLPRCDLLGPNVTRLPASVGSAVALTFDDGPDPDVTPRVLDMLATAGARATFFCIGERALRYPGLIAELVAAGHGVENHTHRHRSTFALNGPGQLASEIEAAQRALSTAAGRTPRFFRPPAGIQNPWVPGVVAQAGLRHVSWTRRGFDTTRPDAHAVTGRLLRHLDAGDVLLMHDGNAARDSAGRPVVLDVLPRILDGMSAHGFRSEPLHVLLPSS